MGRSPGPHPPSENTAAVTRATFVNSPVGDRPGPGGRRRAACRDRRVDGSSPAPVKSVSRTSEFQSRGFYVRRASMWLREIRFDQMVHREGTWPTGKQKNENRTPKHMIRP